MIAKRLLRCEHNKKLEQKYWPKVCGGPGLRAVFLDQAEKPEDRAQACDSYGSATEGWRQHRGLFRKGLGATVGVLLPATEEDA